MEFLNFFQPHREILEEIEKALEAGSKHLHNLWG